MEHRAQLDERHAEQQARLAASQHQHSMDLEAHKAMVTEGADTPQKPKAPISMTPMRDLIAAIAQIGQSNQSASATMAAAIEGNSKATMALAKAVVAPRRNVIERDRKTGRAVASVQTTVQ